MNNKCEKEIECFICYENLYENEIPIKLQEQQIYIKICACDVWIHNKCLIKWFTFNNKCPICRIHVTKYSTNKIRNLYVNVDINTYDNSIMEISNFNLCLFLMFHIMDMYKNLILFIVTILSIFIIIKLVTFVPPNKILLYTNQCVINTYSNIQNYNYKYKYNHESICNYNYNYNVSNI